MQTVRKRIVWVKEGHATGKKTYCLGQARTCYRQENVLFVASKDTLLVNKTCGLGQGRTCHR